jgi:hypothetical protein
VKKRKYKKRSFNFYWNEAKNNEYNRSSTIEDLPLLLVLTVLKSLIMKQTIFSVINNVNNKQSPQRVTMYFKKTLFYLLSL